MENVKTGADKQAEIFADTDGFCDGNSFEYDHGFDDDVCYGGGHGSGGGFDDGSGYGGGHGSGGGCRYSCGDGSGYGSGGGGGCGCRSGTGCCDGSVAGAGLYYGFGEGCCDGDGSGIKSFCSNPVYYINNIPTLIDYVFLCDTVADGRIINSDLTTTPCYIVRQNNVFAHGGTLEKAFKASIKKLLSGMADDDRVRAFVDCHKNGVKYLNIDFAVWHSELTGSDKTGVELFSPDEGHSIDMYDSMDVLEFIELTKDEYGADIIMRLSEYYTAPSTL